MTSHEFASRAIVTAVATGIYGDRLSSARLRLDMAMKRDAQRELSSP